MKKILSIYLLGLLLLGCSFIEDTEEVISSNLNSEKTDSLSEDKTTKATSIPPTAISIPPTATTIPPAATPIPPTATSIPYVDWMYGTRSSSFGKFDSGSYSGIW